MMNPNFNSYKAEITHPIKYRLYMLENLPAAFFAGIKLVDLSETCARLSVPQKWFNKNPFQSIYLGILTMAAEISTGILCMSAIYKRRPRISMLPVNMKSVFHKKATGKIVFICNDGLKINEVVEEAIASGEAKTVLCHTLGLNQSDEIVAEFYFTWSFKPKSK
ncbi:MAG TPA: DUF4442 domain-containing protein [Panacibacter sp.]|nr:DUF4442 domain-containing protein [Panacibacter sp.]HNP42924.1 DUF4442 domain-containing protein [Panacibacter sp.]